MTHGARYKKGGAMAKEPVPAREKGNFLEAGMGRGGDWQVQGGEAGIDRQGILYLGWLPGERESNWQGQLA